MKFIQGLPLNTPEMCLQPGFDHVENEQNVERQKDEHNRHLTTAQNLMLIGSLMCSSEMTC